MEISPSEKPVRPSNAIELAYYDVTYAMARVSRSAKGRYDQLNPELALKAIRETQERLEALAKLCEEDIVVRKEAAKAAAKEAREFRRQQEVAQRRRAREAERAAARAQRMREQAEAREAARIARKEAAAKAKAANEEPQVVQVPVVAIETGKIVEFEPRSTADYAADGLVTMFRAQREHEAEERAARPSLIKRLLKKAA